ncbi:MAG: bifunctional folylpolyglutamate synthase/dihydrofolate synthase [Lachnospiraceae bacterium]|nr:bifunctional folylpolyglutamate synthase/dihydrofolate synthase [Lachnospiraceae bacterium]
MIKEGKAPVGVLGNQVQDMTYQAAKKYMEQIQKRGSVYGLQPVLNLLAQLDNPQNRLKVIHVAGTNGKGSICTFLEYLYRAEGKRVGRYISPTLHGYLERFQIDGEYMGENRFAALLEEVIPVMEVMERSGEQLPTAFEIETAIAFLFFLRENVDIVVLETGMGGRNDATNVVDKPLGTVFASIGMDHMQLLGDTIEEIAYEKAGIIRQGCPVISYPNSMEIIEILRREKGGDKDLYVVDKSDVQILSETLEQSTFVYRGEKYTISMAGEYQIYNAVTAIETKLKLDGKLDKSGLQKACWAGRFEKVCDHPVVIRDGAHNVDAAKALRESIQKHFTNQKLIFIIGVLKDKEYDKMMAVLCPLADRVYTITPEGQRGLPAAILRESILPYCKQVTACSSVKKAMSAAKQDCQQYEQLGKASAIIAWGSLSYIGQI